METVILEMEQSLAGKWQQDNHSPINWGLKFKLAGALMALSKEYLQDMAEMLEAKLPDNHGFILLTFEFGDRHDRLLTYTASGQREDCIKAMKEWLIRVGEKDLWLKHQV